MDRPQGRESVTTVLGDFVVAGIEKRSVEQNDGDEGDVGLLLVDEQNLRALQKMGHQEVFDFLHRALDKNSNIRFLRDASSLLQEYQNPLKRVI